MSGVRLLSRYQLETLAWGSPLGCHDIHTLQKLGFIDSSIPHSSIISEIIDIDGLDMED